METTLSKIKSSFTALKGEFGYTNVMQAPKIEKVVVSIGTGRVQDKQKEALIRDRLPHLRNCNQPGRFFHLPSVLRLKHSLAYSFR